MTSQRLTPGPPDVIVEYGTMTNNCKKVNMASVDIGPGRSLCQRALDVGFRIVVFTLALAILPLAIPLAILCRLYRAVLWKIILIQNSDSASMVSGRDSIWLQDSSENRAIINALMQFSGTPDIGKLSAVLHKRLILAKDPHRPDRKLFPKLTQYSTTVLHRYVWLEDSDFDISNHVLLIPQPAPSDKADLEKLVGEICSTPLPPDKPAWQFLFLSPSKDDPNYGKHHYCVLRLHHSIADGISLLRIAMQIVVDEQHSPTSAANVQPPARYGSKNVFALGLRACFEAPSLIVSRLMRCRDQNIIHGPTLSGIKLVSWSEPLDLNLIKSIRSATGTTINDVVLSCLATTFREYFKLNSPRRVPSEILAYIPMDIRSPSASITMDNQFALVFLGLPLDDDDQLKTLKKTKQRMDKIKNSLEPVVNAYTIEYCMNRLPSWLTRRFFDWASAKSTIVVSNVPGPQEAVSIGGQAIEALVFWPPQKTNIGVSASIFSYRDTIRLGIYVDKNVMAYPRMIVDGFIRSVNKLANTIKTD